MHLRKTECKPTSAVFQHEPDQVFGNYDFVESGDVRMDELSVVVDFSGEVRIALIRRLEDDLRRVISVTAASDIAPSR